MSTLRFSLFRVSGLGLALLLHAASSAAQISNVSLIDAVKAGDVGLVRTLLSAHSDVNLQQADGATALHWAAHAGHSEIIAMLLRAGARVNVANDLGVMPLSLACEHGEPLTVNALLEAGADSNATLHSGETALMTCARSGNVASVNGLLAHKANLNARESTQGQTALMWAVAEHHVDVARTLIDHGADVHAASHSGFTPLLFAAREGDLDVIRLLLDRGANLEERAKDGTNALIVATVRGHAHLALALLDLGADPNAMDSGYSALHWATGNWETMLAGKLGIQQSPLSGVKTDRMELIASLLRHGANPNARASKNPPLFGPSNFRLRLAGATPFFIAAMAADVEVMRVLIAAGADPAIALNDGTTPLMVAAGLGRIPAESSVTEDVAIDAVKYLFDLGINTVNTTNSTLDTALHGVAYLGWSRMLQVLVDHGANVNVVNKRGLTPLLIADGKGDRAVLTTVPFHQAMAALLRKLGADDKLGTPDLTGVAVK